MDTRFDVRVRLQISKMDGQGDYRRGYILNEEPLLARSFESIEDAQQLMNRLYQEINTTIEGFNNG